MSNEKNDLIEEVLGSVGEDKPQRKVIKRIKVVGPDNYGMWYLGWENGGELPKYLKNNKYLKYVEAERAAQAYNMELDNA